MMETVGGEKIRQELGLDVAVLTGALLVGCPILLLGTSGYDPESEDSHATLWQNFIGVLIASGAECR